MGPTAALGAERCVFLPDIRYGFYVRHCLFMDVCDFSRPHISSLCASDARIDSPPSARSPLRDCSASEGESDEREAAFIHLSFRAPPRSHGFPTRSAGSAVEAQFLLFPFQIQPFFFFLFFLPLCLMFYFRLVNHRSRHQLHSFISLDCRASRLRESSGLVFMFSYLRCLRQGCTTNR